MLADLILVLDAPFDGSGLTDFVRTFVGNIFLAIVGVGAVACLFRREFVRLVEFIALALVVGTFIYAPEMWRSLAESVARAFGS